MKKCSGAYAGKRFQNGKENFSGFLRERLLARTNYKNENLRQQLLDLRYELRKIGVNVNQIAKKVNAGYGTQKDLADLKFCLMEIRKNFLTYEEMVMERWESQN